MNKMRRGSEQDDVFDWWMLRIEVKLDRPRPRCNRCASRWIRHWRRAAGTQPGREPQRSPSRLPLFVNAQLGFAAVYLLADYDDIARKLILAHHTAFIDRSTLERWLNEGAHALRSLFFAGPAIPLFGLHARRFRIKRTPQLGRRWRKFGELPRTCWKARALEVRAAHRAPWSATACETVLLQRLPQRRHHTDEACH